MRNRNPEVVEIVDEEPLVFQCKKCGRRWSPTITPSGRLARGAWQCPDACKPDIAELPKGTFALLEGFMRDLADIQADPGLSDRVDEKMMAIKCRIAIQELEKRYAKLGKKGLVNGETIGRNEDWIAIEQETSPLKRLERRVEFTRNLLRSIEEELREIREKWGL